MEKWRRPPARQAGDWRHAMASRPFDFFTIFSRAATTSFFSPRPAACDFFGSAAVTGWRRGDVSHLTDAVPDDVRPRVVHSARARVSGAVAADWREGRKWCGERRGVRGKGGVLRFTAPFRMKPSQWSFPHCLFNAVGDTFVVGFVHFTVIIHDFVASCAAAVSHLQRRSKP
ncbi:hypothetical protein TraAM80_02259 [Trypanosoma rangeli]|uniref:Uncharacterized protein n=1 Tax=Trypanosoma rangeli TaxID=5698 RepID=A0A422NV32_TRYRA|nr:uncharacterized protein TraAM80_02259 [Trypanosoma rangeli]RNF09312.1 hypothetical protein TraAM80_02259 [Trypanosoma rangeli]|eukprot:RNF09312.1 hypothetical protein TraAM80_02259 [Trypanosoma rangeli]